MTEVQIRQLAELAVSINYVEPDEARTFPSRWAVDPTLGNEPQLEESLGISNAHLGWPPQYDDMGRCLFYINRILDFESSVRWGHGNMWQDLFHTIKPSEECASFPSWRAITLFEGNVLVSVPGRSRYCKLVKVEQEDGKLFFTVEEVNPFTGGSVSMLLSPNLETKS